MSIKSNDTKAIEIISKVIIEAVNKCISSAPFDKTFKGVVKDNLGNNYYNLDIQGNIYKVKCLFNLENNEIVNVVFPQNNPSNMFILPNNYNDAK